MKKIICIIFSVLFVMTAIMPLTAFADESGVIYDLDNTEIETDLASIYPELHNSFPIDLNDSSVSLIYFTEFGYTQDFKENGSDYNLYLYIYNPSLKGLSSDIGKIQFATKWSRSSNGEITAKEYSKFDLKLLKQSGLGTGAVYKYKVLFDSPDFLYMTTDGSRRYDISGIELSESEFDIEDYTVGTTYTFSGFAKGLSYESRDKSTLACVCDQLTTISVDVHQVSYLTGNSPLGVGYSNQVNSVYFSLPQDIEKKFGDLFSIKYEYNHYYTSPIIVTNNEDSYKKIYNDLGVIKDHELFDYSIRNYYFKSSGSTNGFISKFNYGYPYYEDSYAIRRFDSYEFCPQFLSSLFFYGNKLEYGNVVVSDKELLNYFKHYSSSYHTGKVLGYSADLFDLEKSEGYKVETKNINQTFTLEGYMSTHNNFQRWLAYGFTNVSDFEDIEDVKYIEKINSGQVFLSENFEKTFLVDDVFKNDFSDFYSDAYLKNENVYLLRYAYRPDYYSLICEGYKIDGDFLMAQGNTYLNFDIIQFSFKDSKGNETIIPVVSDPTNGAFNVTVTDPDRDFGDFVKDILDGTANQDPEWRKFVALVVFAIFFIIIVTAFVLAIIYIPGFGASVLSLLIQLKDLALVGLKNLGNSIKTGVDNLAESSKKRVEEVKKRRSQKKQKKQLKNNDSPKKKTYRKNKYRRNQKYNRYRGNFKKRYRR